MAVIKFYFLFNFKNKNKKRKHFTNQQNVIKNDEFRLNRVPNFNTPI